MPCRRLPTLVCLEHRQSGGYDDSLTYSRPRRSSTSLSNGPELREAPPSHKSLLPPPAPARAANAPWSATLPNPCTRVLHSTSGCTRRSQDGLAQPTQRLVLLALPSHSATRISTRCMGSYIDSAASGAVTRQIAGCYVDVPSDKHPTSTTHASDAPPR